MPKNAVKPFFTHIIDRPDGALISGGVSGVLPNDIRVKKKRGTDVIIFRQT